MPQDSSKSTKSSPHDIPLLVTITKVVGRCYRGYKEGDQFILKDFTHVPEDFCQGAGTVLFPIFYALSFGAEFPFEDNPRSLHTYCPDAGAVEFLTQVLTESGEVERKPKVENAKPNPKKLVISVEEVKGHCVYDYKVGDSFETTGLRTPASFCGAAYNAIFPVLFALNFGARFPFSEDGISNPRITCPDGAKVRFKVRRVE